MTPPLLDSLLAKCEVIIELARTNYGDLIDPAAREACSIHYDASRTDAGAQSWFDSPSFKLSYNRAYTDNGRRIRLTPSMAWAAYSMGHCLKPPTSSNNAMYAFAITAGAGQEVTGPQFISLAYDVAVTGRFHQSLGHARFATERVDEWIVGHNERAIYNKKDNPTKPELWGKLGRKPDPIGDNPDKPVLSLVSLRAAVAVLLNTSDHTLWANWPAPHLWR